MDDYIAKNRDFISSHKLKLFKEDEWSYFLKYVQEIPEPTFGERKADYFIIGQAVDDYLTHGKEWWDEHYVEVTTTVTDVEEKIVEIEATMEETKNKETKTYLNLVEKLKSLKNLNGKIQLTRAENRTILQIIGEHQENSLFAKRYTKAVLTATIEGFPPLRGELDHFDKEARQIRDLKTCADIERFDPANYVFQMAFYHLLAEEAEDVRCDVYLDVVDKCSPAKSICVHYSEGSLMEARGEILSLLQKLNSAQITGMFNKPDQKQQWKSPYYGYEGYGRMTEYLEY